MEKRDQWVDDFVIKWDEGNPWFRLALRNLIRQVVAEEMEACARIAREVAQEAEDAGSPTRKYQAKRIADLIRKRKEE